MAGTGIMLCDDLMELIGKEVENKRQTENNKKIYNKFVETWDNEIKWKGDYIYNDITYNWLYGYETFRFNRDIQDFKDIPNRHRVKLIKKVIDEGYVENY